MAAIKTMNESKTTWEYVSRRLIEEVRSQGLAENAEGNAATFTAVVVRRSPAKLRFVATGTTKKGKLLPIAKSRSRTIKNLRKVTRKKNRGSGLQSL